MKFLTKILPLILLAAAAAPAKSALIDRGGGLIYDDVLDITWLQDAAYIQTSGYSSWNGLNWFEGRDWAGTLEYYDPVRDIIWSDWRLPTTINDFSSYGFDSTGLSSELAYMYYINLGYEANPSFNASDPNPSSSNYNPFINLDSRGFWSDTLFIDEEGNPSGAWYLHFHFGFQAINDVYDGGNRVWAVRDGDVAAIQSVPEPSMIALFSAGLVGLGFSRRRRNRH